MKVMCVWAGHDWSESTGAGGRSLRRCTHCGLLQRFAADQGAGWEPWSELDEAGETAEQIRQESYERSRNIALCSFGHDWEGVDRRFNRDTCVLERLERCRRCALIRHRALTEPPFFKMHLAQAAILANWPTYPMGRTPFWPAGRYRSPLSDFRVWNMVRESLALHERRCWHGRLEVWDEAAIIKPELLEECRRAFERDKDLYRTHVLGEFPAVGFTEPACDHHWAYHDSVRLRAYERWCGKCRAFERLRDGVGWVPAKWAPHQNGCYWRQDDHGRRHCVYCARCQVFQWDRGGWIEANDGRMIGVDFSREGASAAVVYTWRRDGTIAVLDADDVSWPAPGIARIHRILCDGKEIYNVQDDEDMTPVVSNEMLDQMIARNNGRGQWALRELRGRRRRDTRDAKALSVAKRVAGIVRENKGMLRNEGLRCYPMTTHGRQQMIEGAQIQAYVDAEAALNPPEPTPSDWSAAHAVLQTEGGFPPQYESLLNRIAQAIAKARHSK